MKKGLIGRYYRFTQCSQFIHFTPLKDILSEAEIKRVECLFCIMGECYANAYRVAIELGCEYCEGVIINGVVSHAFNRIIRNGQVYYIDVTGDCIDKMEGNTEMGVKEALLLRIYCVNEIKKVVKDFKAHFATIEYYVGKNGPKIYISNNGKVEYFDKKYIYMLEQRIKIFSKSEYKTG